MSKPIFLSDWTFVKVAGVKADLGTKLHVKDVVVSGIDTAVILRDKDYIRRALLSSVKKGADRGKKANKLFEQFKPSMVQLTKEIGVSSQ